jgi:phosphohistidine swiveling domain-containing protein
MTKSIYSLEEAVDLGPDKLGGKGASLVRMRSLGLPVTPAFIITTDASRNFPEESPQISGELMRELELQMEALQNKAAQITGQTTAFGDVNYPLLVSVRSGAPISMPGQMATLLNVGLTPQNLKNKRFDDKMTLELYLQMLKSFANAKGIERDEIDKALVHVQAASDSTRPAELSAVALNRLVDTMRNLLQDKLGGVIAAQIENADDQLALAIRMVWESWNRSSLHAYRRSLGVGVDLGTAVVVQMMVLGNKGPSSGSGVVFSRDLMTGKSLAGSFKFRSQGEEIVSGESSGQDSLNALAQGNKKLFSALKRNVELLEGEFKNPLDIEFTIEDGKLWFLQARAAPLSDRAMIEFVVSVVEGQLGWSLSQREAVERIRPSLMERLYLPTFSRRAIQDATKRGLLLTKGVPASPGVAVGRIVVNRETANRYAREKKPFIWVRDALDPKEHQVMRLAAGVISIRSSVGSHGAIMANVLKRPCLVGCERIEEVNEEGRYVIIDGQRFQEDEGTEISVDAMRGDVFVGVLPTEASGPFPALKVFEKWWDTYDGTQDNTGLITRDDGRPHSPWGNGTRPDTFHLVDEFRQQARDYLQRKGWNTEKAQVVEVMQLVPEEMRIKQVVVDATDRELLSQILRDVIKTKRPDGTPLYWNGPRTALGPGAEGVSPWQMGMKTEEQIDAFLTQRNFQGVARAKSGGYPRWIAPDPTDPWKSPPAQIIVMYDPAEKGVEEFEAEHFVCNVSCRSNPDEVSVDINLGTAQLRSFENIKPEKLVRLSMELNPAIQDYRGRRRLIFGRGYWNIEMVAHLPEFKALSLEQLKVEIEERMTNGDLSDATLEALVGARNLKIARYVEGQVFGEWWTKYQLPYRMRALDEVFSLQVLEIQGRADTSGDIIWFLVYDAKGRDEKKTLADAAKSK